MPLVWTDVQKAMLTPSLVWAYWMRGSIAVLSYAVRSTPCRGSVEAQDR